MQVSESRHTTLRRSPGKSFSLRQSGRSRVGPTFSTGEDPGTRVGPRGGVNGRRLCGLTREKTKEEGSPRRSSRVVLLSEQVVGSGRPSYPTDLALTS